MVPRGDVHGDQAIDHSPSSSSVWRSSTRRGSLMSSTATVARPIRVRPSNVAPSHSKWRFHDCRRGLNNRTISPVIGSRPDRFGPLLKLHRWQLQARLSISSEPPCCRATTCSRWNKAPGAAKSGSWQYSHRYPARSRTNWRSVRDITPRESVEESRGLSPEGLQ